MERIFNKASVIKLLKEGLTKPNPENPNRMMWTLEDLDKPSVGWIECVNSTKGNKAFPQGYKGVEFQNLARIETPKPKPPEEKVEVVDPRDYSTDEEQTYF